MICVFVCVSLTTQQLCLNCLFLYLLFIMLIMIVAHIKKWREMEVWFKFSAMDMETWFELKQIVWSRSLRWFSHQNVLCNVLKVTSGILKNGRKNIIYFFKSDLNVLLGKIGFSHISEDQISFPIWCLEIDAIDIWG